jgi:hypothetical protein
VGDRGDTMPEVADQAQHGIQWVCDSDRATPGRTKASEKSVLLPSVTFGGDNRSLEVRQDRTCSVRSGQVALSLELPSRVVDRREGVGRVAGLA